MNNKIYVLQIGMTPNAGGVESYVMNLYRKIDRTKIQFDFIDWYGKNNIAYTNEIKKLGGNIYKIPARRVKPIENLKLLDTIINSGKYDYIYNNLNSLSYISGITSALKNHNLKVIIHSHNDNIESFNKLSIFLDSIHKKIVKKNHLFRFACSRGAGIWMFGQMPFKVIPDSINTTEFGYHPNIRKEYRKKLGVENKIVFGNIARFSSQKNFGFLVEVFKKLHDIDKRSILLLVGDGEEKAEIRHKISKLGLTNFVFFLGMRSDVANILQAMDVMISPSIFEGFGMSVLEAECSGLPCFVSEAFHNEVLLTPEVTRLPLSKGADYWAKEIFKHVNKLKKRKSFSLTIKENGFDNSENAKYMENFFISGRL